jgi:protein TonB
MHSLLFFRIFSIEKETESSKPTSYRVTLKYFSAAAEVQKEQPKKRLKKEKRKQKSEKEIIKKEQQPVVQEEVLVQDESEIQNESMEEDTPKFAVEGEIDGNIEAIEGDQSENLSGAQSKEDIRYIEAVEGLRSRIMKNKIYPQVARKRNIEGVVQLLLTLDAQGQLLELSILESSGNKILDKAALSLIKKVLPYEHGLGQEFSVKIPIRYDLS